MRRRRDRTAVGRSPHLQPRVRSFFDAPLGAGAAPLELLQAALDELEHKVQPSGRGSRVFPYNRVVVTVAQPAADRAAIEAVFGQLEARLRERLTEVRCEIPATLAASVVGVRQQRWRTGRCCAWSAAATLRDGRGAQRARSCGCAS